MIPAIVATLSISSIIALIVSIVSGLPSLIMGSTVFVSIMAVWGAMSIFHKIKLVFEVVQVLQKQIEDIRSKLENKDKV